HSPTITIVGPVEATAATRARTSQSCSSPTITIVGPVEAASLTEWSSTEWSSTREASPTITIVGPVEAEYLSDEDDDFRRALRRSRSSAPLKLGADVRVASASVGLSDDHDRRPR